MNKNKALIPVEKIHGLKLEFVNSDIKLRKHVQISFIQSSNKKKNRL